MRGRSGKRWDPGSYLQERHPDVRVVDTWLQDRLQGQVDVEGRIIWLDLGLTPAERRSTLAYEIAQYELGPTPDNPCLAAAHARAAVDWAALMLIPSEMFAAAWALGLDLAAMADFCGVDESMFRARIRAASDRDQDVAIAAINAMRLSA